MIWLAFGAFVSAAGCSTWTTNPAGKSLLQPARMSPDSVVVEFAMLDLDEIAETRTAELWKEADEQQIPVETRKMLAAQGFRCGVVGNQLPSWVTDELVRQSKHLKLDKSDQTAVISDVLTERRIQTRANQRRAVPVGLKCKELLVSPSETDPTSSQSLAEAQCHLSLVVEPQGDGKVALTLTPEIQHGPMHHRWVGQDGRFRLDASRDSVRFEELETVATLLPGQTLVLSALPGHGGLGRAFASTTPSESLGAGKIFLFRLAQTQFDDLFSPLQTRTPIATESR